MLDMSINKVIKLTFCIFFVCMFCIMRNITSYAITEKFDYKGNKLVREVIRIDVLRIMHMSDVVANIRPILIKYGFKFDSRDICNIDLSVEDDDELETYDIKRDMNKWDNRKYVNKDEQFVLNENIIFFEKRNFCNYKGINYYLEMMTEIMEEILKTERERGNSLYIDRIGVRKVAGASGRNFEDVSKSFKYENFDNKEVYSYDEFESIIKTVLQNDNENLNILKTLEKGIIEESGEKIKIYNSTLDIDAYCREYGENVQKKDLQKELKKLGDILYKQLLPYNIEISN